MAKWTVDDMPDQTGRTVLVTGANSGLGLRSAEALASRGARVLMGCRNQVKAAVALETVRNAAADAPPEVVPLDLADLEDVRACAERLTNELNHLDVLMNNAGAMAPRQRTRQGFEMQFGTNHLGHFAHPDRMGALPQLYAATMPDVGPDDYWGPDGFMERRGWPKRVGRSGGARDGGAARRLWEASEKLTGVTYIW